MEKEEAKKILEIMSEADGGCHVCAGYLFNSFIKEFGFKDLAIKVYKKEFDEDLEIEQEDKTEP